MSVAREYTISEISLKDQFATSQETVSASQSLPTNSLLQGGLSRTSTTIGRSATVAAGEDIRPALESLRSAGGGTLVLLEGVHTVNYNITGFDGLRILGEGRDLTVIDFLNTDSAVVFSGTGANNKKNLVVKDLSIKNSAAEFALLFDHAFYISVENVTVSDCLQSAFEFNHCYWFDIRSCFAINNGENGYRIGGDPTGDSYDFSFENCRAYEIGGNGFSIFVGAAYVYSGTFLNCTATSNELDGFDVLAAGLSVLDVVFTNCVARANLGAGFDTSQNANSVSFLNCSATGNTGNGFEMEGTDFSILGGYSTDPITLGAGGVMVGHSTSDITTATSVTSGVSLNRNERPKEQYTIISMKNTSGSLIPAPGHVVVYGTDTDGLDCTRTTTAGNKRVCGVTTTSIADGAIGGILVQGFTSSLKVDGTADIAVGDFLSCHTVLGVAKKAVAGEMVFARALEAYTTNDSNGLIDALVITPRLI